jgi:hypothetical protein
MQLHDEHIFELQYRDSRIFRDAVACLAKLYSRGSVPLHVREEFVQMFNDVLSHECDINTKIDERDFVFMIYSVIAKNGNCKIEFSKF